MMTITAGIVFKIYYLGMCYFVRKAINYKDSLIK